MAVLVLAQKVRVLPGILLNLRFGLMSEDFAISVDVGDLRGKMVGLNVNFYRVGSWFL